MKQKPRWTLEMLTASLAVLCGLLVLVLLIQRPTAWLALLALVVLWGVVVVLFRCQLRKWVARWMCGGSFEGSKLQFSLEPLSQPAALLSGETVLWYNAQFRTRLLNGQDALVNRVQKVLPGLDLQQCRKQEGQLLTLADGMWSVHSSTVPGDAESMTLLVLNEETALRKVEAEYKASRPGYLVFLVDGYDDVFGDMLDSERARLLEGINRTLEDMIGRGSGFLRRVASGRYIAVVEERQMEQFANRGYDVLDKIRALDPSVNLSLSIGIGRGAKTLREAQDMAVQALDMAQGRGGDQAAEMTPDGFTFYGGVSHGVEKRSKVRSRIVADQLVKLIKEADHVVIMGHRMSDLDAIGSAEGVLRICKICDVPAVIAVRRDATLAGSLIDALCRAGQKDDFIDPKDALPIISKRTLCIVVDTYQVGLVESKDILEKCGKVAVIDHHRKGVGYIENPALVCHEPYSSSASELVTELLQYVGERDDKPNRVEAEGLLSGIMLDTRDFTLHTGVRTFEAAAALRRYGAETERVRQLFDVTMVEYNAKADLVEKARMYKNCAISVSGEVAPEARVAIAQAANDLLTIQGVDASFVAVQVGTGVNISARSLGAVNVQVIMESLGGGGHQTMAAAQLKHITPEAARARIEGAIDKYYASQKKGRCRRKINGTERITPMKQYDYLIVGAGLYGAVFAQEAKKAGKKCLVIDKRSHIAGNIYTEPVEGINVHRYGAHIFHTNNKAVWQYVNQFAEFNRYTNSPVANYHGEIYNLPFNMNTFNKMWGVVTPAEAKAKIEEQKKEAGITDPQNLEEQAISLVGTDIYEKLIKGYTGKQWGRPCTELPAFIIKRLPVRFTYDDNYFNALYQGIPNGGYTAMVEKMLDGTEVRLNVDYLADRENLNALAEKVVYTGPVDAYFGYRLGALQYRSVRFETEVLDTDNYQGNAVVNYTDAETPYTRIIEHKHFEFGTQPKTVISREYSAEWKKGDEPYYPVNDEKNGALYAEYKKLADAEPGVIFGGRLGEYKYYDMDKVIEVALDVAAKELK